MRLIELIQSVDTSMHQGTARAERRPAGPDPVRVITDGLAEVRRTNERYFQIYWGLLTGAFILTLALALILRNEMGGLAVVLGAGGVIQGGLLTKLSAEWKEKTRVEMVVVLARTLPSKDMVGILKELLAGIRKS
jgi:hypothetical protein